MATTVKITETFDLKTTVNKLGIIGIHTPDPSEILQLYPGLCKNHRFIKLNKCDVHGVCASVLPADPLSVGVSAGDVAPEDMFNPILYKPVSNESFDNLVARMYDISNDAVPSLAFGEDSTAPWNVYYAQLAEAKRWKKAMPQNGFALRGLYPLCHTVINTFGNVIQPANNMYDPEDLSKEVPDLTSVPTSDDQLTVDHESLAYTLRGRAVRMPRLPLHTTDEAHTTSEMSLPVFTIPKTYVAMFLIPPARLHEFYYRMRVTWTITFSNVVSSLEAGNLNQNTMVYQTTYNRNFNYPSKSLDNVSSTVDTTDVSLNKIMES